MKLKLAILLFLLVLGAQAESGRKYFKVTVEKMASGKNFHTHVQVTGKVAYVGHEPDGDTHIRLTDGGIAFIVVECIPELPCTVPKVGNIVTVKGISRFDGEHKWYEVHPVERLEVSN